MKTAHKAQSLRAVIASRKQQVLLELFHNFFGNSKKSRFRRAVFLKVNSRHALIRSHNSQRIKRNGAEERNQFLDSQFLPSALAENIDGLAAMIMMSDFSIKTS